MATTRELFFDDLTQQLVADLVTVEPRGIAALTEGDTEIGFDIYTRASLSGYTSAGVRLGIGIPDDGSGSRRAQGGTFFLRVEEELTSGPNLVIGKRYQIIEMSGGDDFLNVGAAANSNGCVFTATGTTPTAWSGTTIYQVTTDLAYNADAAAVQAAVRDLGGIFALASVLGNGPYLLIGGDFSVWPPITATTNNLTPQCEASWFEVQEGNGLDKVAQQRIDIEQVPCALATSATLITLGSASIVPVETGVTNTKSAVLDLLVTGSPYAGTLTLAKGSTVSAGFAFNAAVADVKAAFASLTGIGTANVSVDQVEAGPVNYRYRATFAASLGDVTGISVEDAGVTFAVGRRFSLDLDTFNMVTALSGQASRAFGLELELTIGATVFTAFQNTVTITNDLLNNASSAPFPIADFQPLNGRLTQFANNSGAINIGDDLAINGNGLKPHQIWDASEDEASITAGDTDITIAGGRTVVFGDGVAVLFGTGVATSWRNALGLGTADSPAFAGITIGGGTTITRVLSAVASLDLSTGSKTVTVTGAAVGDTVVVNRADSTLANVPPSAQVTAANTVTVVAAGTTDTSVSYRVTVTKF